MSNNRTVNGQLGCAFGEPWMGDHPLCRTESRRLVERFQVDVRVGVYDARGFTAKDRKAAEKFAPQQASLFSQQVTYD